MDLQLSKGQQIVAGNFIISIGAFDTTDVAIINKSQSSGFSKLASCKRSKKLRKVKRDLKPFLNSNTTFTFQFLQSDGVQKLINILK